MTAWGGEWVETSGAHVLPRSSLQLRLPSGRPTRIVLILSKQTRGSLHKMPGKQKKLNKKPTVNKEKMHAQIFNICISAVKEEFICISEWKSPTRGQFNGGVMYTLIEPVVTWICMVPNAKPLRESKTPS